MPYAKGWEMCYQFSIISFYFNHFHIRDKQVKAGVSSSILAEVTILPQFIQFLTLRLRCRQIRK